MQKSKIFQRVLILFIVASVFWIKQNIEDSKEVSELLEEFWNEKLLNHVTLGIAKEVPFSQHSFILEFGDKYGLENHFIYTAMSGSMITLPGSQEIYLHFSRIIQMECKDPYTQTGVLRDYCSTDPIRSLVFAQILDKDLNPIKSNYLDHTYPRVVEIFEPNTPKNSGPEDARAIIDPWGNPILVFNMGDVDGARPIWKFNITTGGLQKLVFERQGNDTNTLPKEKNWIPLFIGSKLRYIYSWNPVKLVECVSPFKDCTFSNPLLKSDLDLSLRGGSSLVVYRDYYLGIVRTHSDCSNGRFYRPRLIMLSPKLETVYLSEILLFEGMLFRSPFWSPKEDKVTTGEYSKIVTSLTFTQSHDSNDWIAGFSVNDQKNILVVIRGLRPFIDSILKKNSISDTAAIPNLILRASESAKISCPSLMS